jgi:hypothetical protein
MFIAYVYIPSLLVYHVLELHGTRRRQRAITRDDRDDPNGARRCSLGRQRQRREVPAGDATRTLTCQLRRGVRGPAEGGRGAGRLGRGATRGVHW